jgi:hypothetical protein
MANDILVTSFRETIYRCQDKSIDGSIPIVVAGNKADMGSVRAVTYEEAFNLFDSWKVPFYEVSAKQKSGVEESWKDLVKMVVAQKQQTKKPLEKAKKKCTIL